MSGRKPISVPYVFEKEKYLNLIFILYHSRLYHKKLKKKYLKSVLVKNDKVDFNDPIVYRTAFKINSIVFIQKCLLHEKGLIDRKELNFFANKDSKQTFYDSMFDNVQQLSKYLNYLKHDLGLIINKHNKRGTFWDFTDRGLREIEKFYIKIQIDFLNEVYPKYYDSVKDDLLRLVSPEEKILEKFV